MITGGYVRLIDEISDIIGTRYPIFHNFVGRVHPTTASFRLIIY